MCENQRRCCNCGRCNCCCRGPQGPQGPQGIQGVQGIQGKTGARGEKGDKGEQGVGTTIKGAVASVEELNALHPFGPPEDAYLVNGVLYIWSVEEGWHGMGSVVGPQGPQGAQGIQGVQGEKGAQGVQGAQGPQGVQGAQGPMGAQGPQGVQGEKGAQGEQGVGTTIKGTVASVEELNELHPFGPPEDSYLVNGELYIWNAEQGWHSMGSIVGPAATSYMMMPFASQVAPLTHAANGVASRTTPLAFGLGDGRGNLSALDDYSVQLTDGAFSLDDKSNIQAVFSLPFDVTLRSIYATVGNWGQFLPIGQVFPYVRVYSAPQGSNDFTPLVGAVAEPTTPIGPGSTSANTMRSASVSGLEINLQAGTRIAICGEMRIAGDSSSQSYYLYYTGSLGFSYFVQP